MFHYRPPAPHSLVRSSSCSLRRANTELTTTTTQEKTIKKAIMNENLARLNMEIHSRRRLFSQVGRSPLNIVCVALTGLKKQNKKKTTKQDKNSPCASWKAAGMREELSENDHENKNKQPGLNVCGCGSSEAFTTQKQQQTLTN